MAHDSACGSRLGSARGHSSEQTGRDGSETSKIACNERTKGCFQEESLPGFRRRTHRSRRSPLGGLSFRPLPKAPQETFFQHLPQKIVFYNSPAYFPCDAIAKSVYITAIRPCFTRLQRARRPPRFAMPTVSIRRNELVASTGVAIFHVRSKTATGFPPATPPRSAPQARFDLARNSVIRLRLSPGNPL